ncbi:nuclear factor erythroid 2-related factor 1 isoform X1, partial [Lates japonicus]
MPATIPTVPPYSTFCTGPLNGCYVFVTLTTDTRDSDNFGEEAQLLANRQKESEEEKPNPQENKDEEQESWRNGVNLQGAQPVDGETGESIPEQLPGLGSQTSLSLQECLRLLEATFPFGEESE